MTELQLPTEPLQESVAAFELLDVTIGINFHWERKEDQRFQGSLKIIVENGKLTGINVIRVEDYLTSVISSEMSSRAAGCLQTFPVCKLTNYNCLLVMIPYGIKTQTKTTQPIANCQLPTVN